MNGTRLLTATAAFAVGGSGHGAAAAGFAPDGLSGPGARPRGRKLTAGTSCPVLESIGGDMRPAAAKWSAPFAPGSAVGRVPGAGFMDLHPRNRA